MSVTTVARRTIAPKPRAPALAPLSEADQARLHCRVDVEKFLGPGA